MKSKVKETGKSNMVIEKKKQGEEEKWTAEETKVTEKIKPGDSERKKRR